MNPSRLEAKITPFEELVDERDKALEELAPLLSFLYFRKTAVYEKNGGDKQDRGRKKEKKGSKREIAGTIFWWIHKTGVLTVKDRTQLCEDWSFVLNTFDVVRSELRDCGILKQEGNSYRIDKEHITAKIVKAFIAL